MRCVQVKRLMSLYLRNEMAAHQREDFERHVAKCDSCRALLESHGALGSALREAFEGEGEERAWDSAPLEGRIADIFRPRRMDLRERWLSFSPAWRVSLALHVFSAIFILVLLLSGHNDGAVGRFTFGARPQLSMPQVLEKRARGVFDETAVLFGQRLNWIVAQGDEFGMAIDNASAPAADLPETSKELIEIVYWLASPSSGGGKTVGSPVAIVARRDRKIRCRLSDQGEGRFLDIDMGTIRESAKSFVFEMDVRTAWSDQAVFGTQEARLGGVFSVLQGDVVKIGQVRMKGKCYDAFVSIQTCTDKGAQSHALL